MTQTSQSNIFQGHMGYDLKMAGSLPEKFEFIDPHVHFWDHSEIGLTWPYLEQGFDHPRLKGMHRLQAPRFAVPEFISQTGEIDVKAIVHIHSAREEGLGLETSWIQRIAQDKDLIRGIVARVSTTDEGLATLLSANSQHNLLRGVRDMDAPQTIGGEDFNAGFAAIVSSGLSVEFPVPLAHFKSVGVLAEQHPEAVIILGHCGLPERRDKQYFRQWSQGLLKLSKSKNVVVKISAIASGADPLWTVASIRPWIECCVETFGPSRAMFASNWPIDRLYRSYEELINSYREIARQWTLGEQNSLFGQTATRVYRLT